MQAALKMLLATLMACMMVMASAGRPPKRDPVQTCIAQQDCIARGTRAVCAEDVLTGRTGAFPNACYMSCANKMIGVAWRKLYSYQTSKYCQAHWLSDPACSTC
ncbi:hypothetical protein COHA_005072 [Chlorella ohadii]|uniref:Uncharacterized protein n=1 Tax=Chlorella ohadii TaxID=2649997 RepID=A0AAD5H5Q7_9CHLO|nr:hypothetical protein COHA_005072 [Chlorella ohadii]